MRRAWIWVLGAAVAALAYVVLRRNSAPVALSLGSGSARTGAGSTPQQSAAAAGKVPQASFGTGGGPGSSGGVGLGGVSSAITAIGGLIESLTGATSVGSSPGSQPQEGAIVDGVIPGFSEFFGGTTGPLVYDTGGVPYVGTIDEAGNVVNASDFGDSFTWDEMTQD